ncbi:MAG: hypothetical protein AABX59_03750 [Nanoarchaeota archaeon]
MSKNKVKPTEKQKKTFEHLKKAKTLQEAMLAGGYSKKSAESPKQNYLDKAGTHVLMEQYKGHLEKAGVSPELLAEIQAEGLFDENAQTRLGYLKETKKDLGITQEVTNVNVAVGVFNRKDYED